MKTKQAVYRPLHAVIEALDQKLADLRFVRDLLLEDTANTDTHANLPRRIPKRTTGHRTPNKSSAA